MGSDIWRCSSCESLYAGNPFTVRYMVAVWAGIAALFGAIVWALWK
jgi:ribosomal protein L37AE/L43A